MLPSQFCLDAFCELAHITTGLRNEHYLCQSAFYYLICDLKIFSLIHDAEAIIHRSTEKKSLVEITSLISSLGLSDPEDNEECKLEQGDLTLPALTSMNTDLRTLNF